MSAPAGSVRGEEQARALRRWREARIAAAPALRRRAARRRRRLAAAVRVGAGAVLAVSILAFVFAFLAHRDAQARDRGDAAQAAARAALTTMLSADPTKADAYVDRVLAISTGEQHERIRQARAGLVDEISRQTGPSTGQVLSTTLVSEPSPSGDIVVLVVAEATNVALIGADTTAKRVAVVVTMTQLDGRWLVAKARQT